MLSVQTVQPLPQGKWVHVSATYDGSSRAAGMKLYLNGAPRARMSIATVSRAARCRAAATACTAATTGSRSASASR